MATDPYYKVCSRNLAFNDHACAPDPMTGRLIEWEHALMWAGRQLQERFAIIPICWWAHRGPGLDKKKNRSIAIARMTEQDLDRYPNKEWRVLWERISSTVHLD